MVDGCVGLSKWVLLGGITEATGVRDEGGVVHSLRVGVLWIRGEEVLV